jgi:hypothetical protein
LAPQLKIEPIH